MKEGILVGSNARQEWLLPWWWEHFHRHNDYPVTFVNFGLSQEKKNWCKERGNLISLRMTDLFIKERDEVCSELTANWEKRFPDTFWESRKGWFKKPFACLLSPYQQTIWLDLDCEVLGSLQPLFGLCDHPSGIGLAKDQNAPPGPFPIYNSGVILFQNNHPIITEWAKQSVEKNGLFRGDQDLLSQIVAEQQALVCDVSPLYNWSIGQGEHTDVVIYHWLGDAAKSLLKNKIALTEFYK